MLKKKYSTDLKLEIVLYYLTEKIGLKKVAKKYFVSPGDIQKWRDAYLEHGVEGLCAKYICKRFDILPINGRINIRNSKGGLNYDFKCKKMCNSNCHINWLCNSR